MTARDYKSTLLLPKTAFPMKADLPKREPERLARWESSDLYGRLRKARAEAGAPKFILHDGPPYANGQIHIGTAMNKIVKDLVVRSKSLLGFDAPYVPGWDCHGLPIELKVDKELGPKKRDMSDVEIRKACRAYAEKWIDNQRADFRRLGILGQWDKPYRTMDFGYQASIAKAFGEFVEKGLVTFGFKSVLWCVQDRTALAEAEVEYADRTDPSIYVAMPIVGRQGQKKEEHDSSKGAWGAALGAAGSPRPYAVIWTTTPWTLPANRAITLGKDIEYVLIQRESAPGAAYLVAEALVPQVTAALGWTDAHPLPHSKKSGEALARAGLRYARPFAQDPYDNFGFLLGEHVSTTDGTGLVHTAPGHGRDDYEVVRRAGFKVDDPKLCPVDEGGFYDVNAPEYLRGKRVVIPKTPDQSANDAVLAALPWDSSGALLLSKKSLSHSYPHCWRCKNPVIFRATHQWFIDLHAIRDKALGEIHDRVKWIPPFGENRIGAMVENRLEWTISRQRRWGSPITFLKCTTCAEKGIVSHFPRVSGGDAKDQEARKIFFEGVYRLFRERGADAWYDDAFPPSYFLSRSSSFPSSSSSPSPSCPSCGGTSFVKLRDILDVWFDSGVSHLAVLRSGDYGLTDPYTATPPVPVMYLEGHDQHRGWFQSSLLTSVALFGRAPYDEVATHGFVMDFEGKNKMSKSIGNTVSPQDVMKKDGADVLRLFFASTDFTDDVRLNPEILGHTAEAYRKIRNTARFLLGNLFDFTPAEAVPDALLEPLDRWILDRAARLVDDSKLAYERYQFHAVARRLLDFVTTDLSAIWCDVRKDTFYVERADAPARRSAQTAAAKLAETIAMLLSPMCPFTAEEIFEHVPGNEGHGERAFLASIQTLEIPRLETTYSGAWDRLVLLRGGVLAALEPLRRSGVVGSAAQAAVEIGTNAGLDADLSLLSLSEEKLAEFFGVPQLVRQALAGGSESKDFYGGISFSVRPADGMKCPRCWQVRVDVEPDGVCARCRRVIGPEPVQSTP